MAEGTRSGVDEQLAPFVLSDVKELKKHSALEDNEAGRGSYGVIYNVTVNGLPCVAKRIHSIFVDQVAENNEVMKKKFRDECVTLSRLKHPNIVHFVGVYYGKDINGSNALDLMLIMEQLPSDLSFFLESHSQVPLPRKLAILLDVAHGLLYLHSHSPQIVHRDLTSRNILLTSDCRAKIADLGVAKLLTPQTLMAINNHTKAPGQPLYMPPEALTENPECTPKIDIFSFGHLSLFAINQEDTQVFEVTITPEMLAQGSIQMSKRRQALEKVGESHCMYSLIIQCLHDKPSKRPETVELVEKLHELCVKYPLVSQETAGVKDLCEVLQDNKELQLKLVKFAKAIDGEIELNKTILALQDHVAELTDQRDSAQAQVLVFKQDFADERRDREAAHSKIADLERELVKQKTLFNDLTMDFKHQLSMAQQDKEAVQKELKETKIALAEAEELNKQQKETEEYWRKQAAQLQQEDKFYTHTAKLEELQAQNAQLQKDCQTKESLVKQLKRDLDKKTNELEKVTKKVQKLEETLKTSKKSN